MTAESLTYEHAGATRPDEAAWPVTLPELRRFEQTVVIGHGEVAWREAATAVLNWGVKRRSGFRVAPPVAVTEGAEFRISYEWGPIAIHEPVRIVAVADTNDRSGFAYGTLPGHPVSGEEAFIVHRNADGTVFLTLRSLTQAAPSGFWRPVFPILLVAQRIFRRRYLRALSP
ncbi:DUF1990 domain-containing protein [Mycobacterium sp. CBMA271]|uniref:DUF1990 family protein n=1 Tax=unclassified Mycobacteroides TaxID=2618759 RepID=UPI0012DDCA00|nr:MULTISPECIES: DUF1990 domain-containing protein [unclassified Mycobacteroides]MUM17881.1 hypothetical protein [Mycobacteroides sp. CBMA 326]MUM20451.1 DUF1990 domain-containing protein [Mycobacteroides sp. CBMA 271]